MSTRMIGVSPVSAKSAPAGPAAHEQFAFELFRQVAKEKDTNVFLSPVCLSTALAMAYAGSEGRTRIQMAKVLRFDPWPQQVASDLQFLMASITQPVNATYLLQVANALWTQQGAHFQPEFASLMRNYYSGDFRTLDFADSERSCTTINEWIAEKTAGRIPQLLQPADIHALTRLVLTNAVYFKGDWSRPFQEAFTNPADFTTANGGTKAVPMMHQTDRFRYADAGELQVLELPYAGHELSMLILLPRADTRAPWLDLTAAKVRQLRGKMDSTRIEVFLPRFKVEARLSLARTLLMMGMGDAFDRFSADFSGMTGKKDWFLSAVLHQTVIEVNEEGTETAAARAIPMEMMAIRPTLHPVFRADRSFVYMIVHEPSNSILFMGRLSDPRP